VRAAHGRRKSRLDSREFERKLKASLARRSMTTKPVIFISYAHADEPEKPRDGEEKWLSFVLGHLRPAVRQGAIDLWVDTLMRGGDEWNLGRLSVTVIGLSGLSVGVIGLSGLSGYR
jgi:hypothetical protein